MKTKLFYSATLLLFFLSRLAFSQSGIEIQAGPSLSQMQISGDGNLVNNPKSILRWRATFNYLIPITTQISLNPGMGYHSTGFSAIQNFDFNVFDFPIPANVTAKTTLHFIELPVLVRYQFGSGFLKGFIQGGPQVGLAIDGNIDLRAKLLFDFKIADIDMNMANSNFNQWELAGNLGAGIIMGNQRQQFITSINYIQGFTDLTDEPILDIKTKRSAITGQLGMRINF